MSNVSGFSERFELPNIPEGPGVCIIADADGRALQVAMSSNIRRRIGNLLDSKGTIAVHGPKIYKAQQEGQRISVRWKLTTAYRAEKDRLMRTLNPLWAP